jgi:hypothetical protein
VKIKEMYKLIGRKGLKFKREWCTHSQSSKKSLVNSKVSGFKLPQVYKFIITIKGEFTKIMNIWRTISKTRPVQPNHFQAVSTYSSVKSLRLPGGRDLTLESSKNCIND